MKPATGNRKTGRGFRERRESVIEEVGRGETQGERRRRRRHGKSTGLKTRGEDDCTP